MDIAFVVGASNPGGKESFQSQMNVVKEIIVQDKPIFTRYGLITYASKANTRMGFGDYKVNSIMMKFVDLIPWTGNGAGLNDALDKAKELFQESSPLKSRKILVVFITSSTGASITELRRQTKELRETGVNILVVPIGNRPDNNEISAITTNKDLVIPLNATQDIDPVLKGIVKIIFTDPCRAINCNFYGVCVSYEDGRSRCVCKTTYPDNYEPVCASDLRTYSNVHAMKVASCQSNITITKVSFGECSMFQKYQNVF